MTRLSRKNVVRGGATHLHKRRHLAMPGLKYIRSGEAFSEAWITMSVTKTAARPEEPKGRLEGSAVMSTTTFDY